MASSSSSWLCKKPSLSPYGELLFHADWILFPFLFLFFSLFLFFLHQRRADAASVNDEAGKSERKGRCTGRSRQLGHGFIFHSDQVIRIWITGKSFFARIRPCFRRECRRGRRWIRVIVIEGRVRLLYRGCFS